MKKYPIPYDPSWEVIDSSKLKAFMACPRSFFFEYLLGWRLVKRNIHLVFGSAVHLGFEIIAKGNYEESTIVPAFNAFMSEYRSEFPDIQDKDNAPKNPGNALQAFVGFIEDYGDALKEETLLYTETAGRVPIDNSGRTISFRIDKIARKKSGELYILDYKTAQRKTQTWADQWLQDFSLGTYLHACKFFIGDVNLMEIFGIFLYKAKNKDRKWGSIDFMTVPIRKHLGDFNEWLSIANQVYDELEENLLALEKEDPTTPLMTCFPKNVTSCTKYSGCSYLQICYNWKNPILRGEDPPSDFLIEFWNPLTYEEKASCVLKTDRG